MILSPLETSLGFLHKDLAERVTRSVGAGVLARCHQDPYPRRGVLVEGAGGGKVQVRRHLTPAQSLR